MFTPSLLGTWDTGEINGGGEVLSSLGLKDFLGALSTRVESRRGLGQMRFWFVTEDWRGEDQGSGRP